MKTSYGRTDRIGLVVVMSLALTGSLWAAGSANAPTILVKEAGAISTTQAPNGDVTTQVDSFLPQVTQQFSRNQECSKVNLARGGQADFTVQYVAASLLDQKFINFVVVDSKGVVLTTQTDHSFAAFVADACHVIKERSSRRH